MPPPSFRSIAAIALPVIAANALLPLQGLIDTGIAGRLPDAAAAAGLGLGAAIFAFIYPAFNFLQYAVSGLSSQAKGRGDDKALSAVMLRALLLALVISLALWLARPVILRAAAGFFHGSDQALALMQDYARIRLWAAPAELALYACLGWFAGQGLSKAILWQQAVLTFSNFLFSLAFVYLLHWDIAGIAAGTVLANYLAAGFSLRLIFRRLSHRPALSEMLERGAFGALLRLNANLFVRTSLLTSIFLYFQYLGSQFGDAVIAANALLLGLLTLAAYALDGVAIAAESLSGQAIGRQAPDALALIIRRTMLSGGMLALAITGLYAAGIDGYIKLMNSHDSVRAAAADYRWFAVFLPAAAVWAYLLDGYYFGATKAQALRNAMIVLAAVTFPLAFLLTKALGNTGLWLAVYAFLLLRAAVLLPNLQQRLLR